MPNLNQPPPDKLDGKGFETLIKEEGKWLEKRDKLTMGRYGVEVRFMKDRGGNLVAQPVSSLPDFEGILPPNGRQFIFDAKVCSQSSLSLSQFDEGNKRRQLQHLLDRHEYGAICFLLIHFNIRVLKTRIDRPATYALPVFRTHTLWREYLDGQLRSIDRDGVREFGTRVDWRVAPRCRKARPCLLPLLQGMSSGMRRSG